MFDSYDESFGYGETQNADGSSEIIQSLRKKSLCHILELQNNLLDMHELVTRYTPLARSLAKNVRSLPYEDALQEAFIGLIVAAEKYDPERGAFSTYATAWIIHYLQVASIQSLPVHVPIGLAKRKHAAYNRGEDFMQCKRAPVRASQKRAVVNISAIQISMTSEEGNALDFPDETIGLMSEVSCKESAHALCRAVSLLPDRQRIAVILRFGLGDGEAHTLEEVGVIMGCSREAVRQLVERALKSLCVVMADHVA